MAIRLEQKRSLACIEVISRADDAVDHEKSNWDAYAASGDRKHLVFLPDQEPTVFICNFELSGKEGAAIKNAMVGGSDDDGKPAVALGSWSYRVVKMTLKAIQNPAGLPPEAGMTFRKDDRGYAHDELMTQLERFGIVGEIFSMYTALTASDARKAAKK